MGNVIRLERAGVRAERTQQDGPSAEPGVPAGMRPDAGAAARVDGRVAPTRSGFALGGATPLVRLRVSAVPAGAERLPAVPAGRDRAQGGHDRAGGGARVVVALGGPSRGAGACGRAVPRSPGSANAELVDAAWVVARLEEAGRTLLALPGTGYSTRLRTSSLDIVRTAMEAYGSEVGRARPSVPSAAHITRMDEALGWIPLIPQDRYVLRRIVGARCLVSPVTGRALYSWRRLGGLLGADHKAVQRWHAQGIAMLVAILQG